MATPSARSRGYRLLVSQSRRLVKCSTIMVPWAAQFMQLLRCTEQYRAPELAPSNTSEVRGAEYGAKTSEAPLVGRHNALVRGVSNGRVSWVQVFVCVCGQRIVLPTHFGQSLCETQTGSGDTVAVWPKYSAAQCGANVYRASSLYKCFL